MVNVHALDTHHGKHWLIAECVVVGDRRPYIAALVTLDDAAFTRWKQRQGKPAGPPTTSRGNDAAIRQGTNVLA